MASMTKDRAPGQAQKITKNQLKKFKKKLKVEGCQASSGETRQERKPLKKN